MAQPISISEPTEEKALLVGVIQKNLRPADVEDSLEELAQLCTTAGAEVVERLVCRQFAPQPATFIGKGKAEQIAGLVAEKNITTVVFDDDLSPAQGRNLEEIIKVKILDRTQMILDIFGQRARTREGSLQVELAQLEYILPRLKRMWTHLERQKGGIGLRGPGEKQLELDRRRIEEHISRVRREIDHVRSRRAEQRRGRKRHGWALLTLVGYTNAGKSTLLNKLTGADVMADDKLFATLDPTTRQLRLPNNQMALITDTVGFIRKLPHHLVDAFQATLEEVMEADLLIHVVDASHPRVEDQIAAVEDVLKSLGAHTKPTVVALNKVDLPQGHDAGGHLAWRYPKAVAISARSGEGLENLCNELADCLRHRSAQVKLKVPVTDGEFMARLKQYGQIHTQECRDEFILLEAVAPVSLLGQYRHYIDPGVDVAGEETEGET